jgi:hypothetical protein
MNHLVTDHLFVDSGFEVQKKPSKIHDWEYVDGYSTLQQAIDRILQTKPLGLFVRVVNRVDGEIVAGWFKGKKVL